MKTNLATDNAVTDYLGNPTLAAQKDMEHSALIRAGNGNLAVDPEFRQYPKTRSLLPCHSPGAQPVEGRASVLRT